MRVPRAAGTAFALGVLAITAAVAAVEAPNGSPLTWEQWHSEPGVVDVAGPLSGGAIVVAAGRHLLRLTPGAVQSELSAAYATTPFAPPTGSEPYIALAQGESTGASCAFPRDTVFAIRPTTPSSVISIGPSGVVRTFVTLSGVGSLNGITFDTTGRFGYRLLVSGSLAGEHEAVVAVDCRGVATTLTRTAPRFEGGLTVAPASFAKFGGDLIAPDEISGRVLAIDAGGNATLIADSGVPSGGDTGVEGVAFVPPGFLAGGAAYTADRGTAGSPHPGTDTLLRLSASAFGAAGVHTGDMLLTTEASDRIVDIECGSSCTARTLGMGAAAAHGEGHLLLVAGNPHAKAPAVPSSSAAGPSGLIIAAVGALAAGAAAVITRVMVLRRRLEAGSTR